MKKYKTHIIIVSGQVIPNVTPVLDESIRPEKVILCVSDKMKEHANVLAGFFKNKKIETEIFELGYAYNFPELQDRFLELATKLEKADSVAVNLTGGTKLMTIAAQMVFSDCPCFYVIPEKDQIVMIDAENPDLYAIQDRINLRDYFLIHGYTINSMKRKEKIPAETVKLCKEILKNYDTFKNYLGVLNALAQKAEEANSLSVRNENSDNICELLNFFYQHRSIEYYDDKKIEFASESDRSFCKGLWLEKYVVSELQKVHDKVGLQDWAGSIQIESASGTKNEIDAAFLYNNELYVIECKTARMDDKSDDALYKLGTIRSYGGLYTRSVIATFRELRSAERQRAKDLDILLVEGKNLNRFAERMIEKIH